MKLVFYLVTVLIAQTTNTKITEMITIGFTKSSEFSITPIESLQMFIVKQAPSAQYVFDVSSFGIYTKNDSSFNSLGVATQAGTDKFLSWNDSDPVGLYRLIDLYTMTFIEEWDQKFSIKFAKNIPSTNLWLLSTSELNFPVRIFDTSFKLPIQTLLSYNSEGIVNEFEFLENNEHHVLSGSSFKRLSIYRTSNMLLLRDKQISSINEVRKVLCPEFNKNKIYLSQSLISKIEVYDDLLEKKFSSSETFNSYFTTMREIKFSNSFIAIPRAGDFLYLFGKNLDIIESFTLSYSINYPAAVLPNRPYIATAFSQKIVIYYIDNFCHKNCESCSYIFKENSQSCQDCKDENYILDSNNDCVLKTREKEFEEEKESEPVQRPESEKEYVETQTSENEKVIIRQKRQNPLEFKISFSSPPQELTLDQNVIISDPKNQIASSFSKKLIQKYPSTYILVFDTDLSKFDFEILIFVEYRPKRSPEKKIDSEFKFKLKRKIPVINFSPKMKERLNTVSTKLGQSSPLVANLELLKFLINEMYYANLMGVYPVPFPPNFQEFISAFTFLDSKDPLIKYLVEIKIKDEYYYTPYNDRFSFCSRYWSTQSLLLIVSIISIGYAIFRKKKFFHIKKWKFCNQLKYILEVLVFNALVSAYGIGCSSKLIHILVSIFFGTSWDGLIASADFVILLGFHYFAYKIFKKIQDKEFETKTEAPLYEYLFATDLFDSKLYSLNSIPFIFIENFLRSILIIFAIGFKKNPEIFSTGIIIESFFRIFFLIFSSKGKGSKISFLWSVNTLLKILMNIMVIICIYNKYLGIPEIIISEAMTFLILMILAEAIITRVFYFVMNTHKELCKKKQGLNEAKISPVRMNQELVVYTPHELSKIDQTENLDIVPEEKDFPMTEKNEEKEKINKKDLNKSLEVREKDELKNEVRNSGWRGTRRVPKKRITVNSGRINFRRVDKKIKTPKNAQIKLNLPRVLQGEKERVLKKIFENDDVSSDAPFSDKSSKRSSRSPKKKRDKSKKRTVNKKYVSSRFKQLKKNNKKEKNDE